MKNTRMKEKFPAKRTFLDCIRVTMDKEAKEKEEEERQWEEDDSQPSPAQGTIRVP